MGGSRKFCRGGGGGGGVGCPENSILVFFSESSADLASFSKQLDPKGPTSSRLSIIVFLRKHTTTCDLPGGMQTRCPQPSGHAHAHS